VDEEDLPAAVELAQDRVADQAGRGLRHPGLDRQPILGGVSMTDMSRTPASAR